MDLSDLLEQVNWMKNNEEKSLEIAKNAFEYATHNFTLDKFLDRVKILYDELGYDDFNRDLVQKFYQAYISLHI